MRITKKKLALVTAIVAVAFAYAVIYKLAD